MRQVDEQEREERAGIRLTEADRAMLRELALAWYPGEQRKQSQTVRRLIREAHGQLANAPARRGRRQVGSAPRERSQVGDRTDAS